MTIALERLLADATQAYGEGNFDEAAELFEKLACQLPDNASLLINYGAALRGASRHMDAENAYRKAIDLEPKNALAWYNLGNVYADLSKHDQALSAFHRADEIAPGTAEILNNIGVQLYEMNDPVAALPYYDAAITANPSFADAWTNRGNAKQRLNDQDAAGADIDHALKLAPENAVFRLNKSAHLAANGHWAEALAWADNAVAADPAYTKAELKRASLLIQQKRLAEGFAAFEVRWAITDWHELPRKLPMPAWTGENITGKTCLVWNEQGFGDALMYARFLTQLKNLGTEVIFACEPALTALMRTSLPDVEVISLNSSMPSADVHASIMSLPHLLGIQDTDALRPPSPYLRPNAERQARWADIVAESGRESLNIGVVWAGNPNQAHDYARSIPFEQFEPLLKAEKCRFFNLLVGPRGAVDTPNLIDHRSQLSDFAETAALISTLDLVISVDSAPAHLAAGLGVPTWILLSFDPDSRYFLETDVSPWYPSARLFRQPRPGDWMTVIANVRATLDAEVSAKT